MDTNIQPPGFGPTQPVYPHLLQLLRVTSGTVPGPNGYASSSMLAANLYIAVTQQLKSADLLPRDREPCLADDVNHYGITPGYYLGRLAGQWQGLPVYEIMGSPSSSPSIGTSRQTFSNVDYQVTGSDDVIVAQIGTLTAPRTVSLPSETVGRKGQMVTVIDESGSATATKYLSIVGGGSTTVVNGQQEPLTNLSWTLANGAAYPSITFQFDHNETGAGYHWIALDSGLTVSGSLTLGGSIVNYFGAQSLGFDCAGTDQTTTCLLVTLNSSGANAQYNVTAGSAAHGQAGIVSKSSQTFSGAKTFDGGAVTFKNFASPSGEVVIETDANPNIDLFDSSTGQMALGAGGSWETGGSWWGLAATTDGVGFMTLYAGDNRTIFSGHTSTNCYLGWGQTTEIDGPEAIMSLGLMTSGAGSTHHPFLDLSAGPSALATPLYSINGVPGVSLTGGGGDTFIGGICTAVGSGSGGTVTSVGTGTGLTGGPITGAGTISLDLTNPNAWTGQQYFSEATLVDGASIAWNLSTNQTAAVTLAGNRTLANPTNMAAGSTYVLRVVQGSGGSHTLAYGTAYKWPGGTAPTLSTTAGAVDIITFYTDGTSMFGVIQQAFA